MRGPYWNETTGVTGEKNFKNSEPNYVTTTGANGQVMTLVGADATEFRAAEAEQFRQNHLHND